MCVPHDYMFMSVHVCVHVRACMFVCVYVSMRERGGGEQLYICKTFTNILPESPIP